MKKKKANKKKVKRWTKKKSKSTSVLIFSITCLCQMSVVLVWFPFSVTLIVCLFIINEFSCFLTFSGLVTNVCSSGIPKVQKEEWLVIQRRSVRQLKIGSHNSHKSNTIRFIAKFYFSIYLYRVFHATTFIELVLFLYCWLIFVIYTLRQNCLVLWAFWSLPWF